MDICQGDIRIRNAERADCPRLAGWWNDGSVMAHAGFPLGLGITPEEIEAKISTDSDDTRRRLILEYRGRAVGEMSYRAVDGNAAEIGIKICEAEYRERGIGRAALSMLVRQLFSMGYARIALDTNLKNTRAQHVYELLGFRKLRVNVDSWKDQLGAPQSSVDYELLPEDFRDLSGQN